MFNKDFKQLELFISFYSCSLASLTPECKVRFWTTDSQLMDLLSTICYVMVDLEMENLQAK